MSALLDYLALPADEKGLTFVNGKSTDTRPGR